MIQVSTQAQLEAAIEAQETDIQAAASFHINTRQIIGYAATITSAEGGHCTITKAAGYDGVLFEVQSDGSLTLQNITLDGAKSTHPYNSNSASLVVVAYGSLILGTDAVLQNNNAHNGGAITCAPVEGLPGRIVLQENVRISYNYAEENGGGIYISRTAPGSGLELSGQVHIAFNQAKGEGGGVYYETSQPDTTLTIRGRVAFDTNSAVTGAGGGLFAKGCALELMDQSAFNFNRSISHNGGGIAWAGSRFEMAQGCRMYRNECGQNGGGMYLTPDAPTDVAIHGTVNSDSAGFAGGGIYLDVPPSGTVDFANAAIVSNTAGAGSGVGGGCVIFGRNTGGPTLSIELKNTNFRLNTSETNGCGLAILFSSASGAYRLSAVGCEFLQNISNGNGGGIYGSNSDGCIMELRDCSFGGNNGDYGGGIYLSQDSPGESTLIIESVTMSENISRNGGGSIFLGKGIIVAANLDQVSLLSNLTNQDGNGGELYSAEGAGRIAIRGNSQIIGNRAASGGGIYHSGERVLTFSGVNFLGNTAAAGQGVYNDGPLEFVTEEELTADIQDGLYLQNQAAAPVIINRLPLRTIVQLERSDYVTPSEIGTPIVVATSIDELSAEVPFAFRAPDSGFAGWEIRLSEDRNEVLLAPVEYSLRYENTIGVENLNPDRYTSFTPTITLLPLASTSSNRFLGWFDALAGGSQVTEIPVGSTGDKLLYARWQAIEYTVSYYGNDAEGPTAENVPLSQRIQGGETALLSDERPIRTGYVFIGWNADPIGTGTVYQPGDTIPHVLANISLYAQWETLMPTLHLLTYEPNDEGGEPAQDIPDQQRITEGESEALSSVIPIRTGYRFVDWNAFPDGTGVSYQPGQMAGPFYADLTVYAQWEAVLPMICTLIYYGNDTGGSPVRNIPSSLLVLEGQSVSLSSIIPLREGYAFFDWNTEPAGTGTAYQSGDNVANVQADISLYAQWSRAYGR